MDATAAQFAALGFLLFVAITFAILGVRERRTHREEIQFFKSRGWEEAYRFPRHYWWHRATNRAIVFGDYRRDKKGVVRLVEKAEQASKKKR